MAAGRIPWIGPLLLVSARSVLWLTSQSLLALVFLALHRPAPFRTAGNWWMINGTLSDLCCLIGLRYFTRREGIRLRDLIGPIRMRWGRDLFLGLGILVLSYPLMMSAASSRRGRYMAPWPKCPWNSSCRGTRCPIWATMYTLTVWWIIQSATEEMTYQGYVLPRLQALTDRTWIALSITGFWFTAQHCMVPFVTDWHYLAYRFLMFLPLILFIMPVYLRIRRLSPLIIAHWPMDFAVAIMTGTSLGAAWTTGVH